MLKTFKIAIFLFCVFTMVMTAPYKPAKRFVSWNRNIGTAIRNTWQRLADKFSSGVSHLTVSAQNMPSHVNWMPARFQWPGFQKLCANLGNGIDVLEPDKSGQTGMSIGKAIKQSFKKIPIEWHFPGYRYCGPNTNLNLRLPRGDKGINKLDEACKEHDKGYMKYPDLQSRIAIDRTLARKAYERLKAGDASRGEKVAARVTITAMCVKLQVTTKVNRVFRRKKQHKEK